MSLLAVCGFESGAAPVTASHAAEGGPANAGALTLLGTAGAIQTSGARSGTRHLRAAANAQSVNRFSVTHVDGRRYWMGCAFRISASPTTAVNIFSNSSATIRVNTSRQLELRTSVTIGTSGVLTVNQWYYIELMLNVSTTLTEDIQGWLDGVSFGQQLATEYSAALANNWDFGPQAAYGTSVNMDFDDIYILDDQGSAPLNTRLDQPKIVSSFPTSDVSRDAGWEDSDDTTTNLFQSVDNQPPVGIAPVAGAGVADRQVKNAISTTTENVVFDLQSADALGIDADDTILATQLITTHGLDSATSTTSCTHQIITGDGHPGTSEASFDPNAASGTWPTNWINGRTLIQSPTITDRSVSPQVEIGKRTAATRVVAVAQVRIDWIYLPVTAGPFVPKPQPRIYSDAVHRASRH